LLGFVLVSPVAVEGATARTAKKRTTASKPAAKKRTTASKPKRSSKRRYSASSARARRLKLARARARARAIAALREAATPKFKLDETGALVPDIRAEAAIIYNPVTGEVLWEENSQNKRSIASMTKVMTAVVFLETDPDLDMEVTIDRSDVRAASVTYLRAGERVKVSDLLHLLLIASDNAAARTLARISPVGSQGFVDRMMEKAIELGLDSTSFADPSGLDARNISSAYDMARLISYAASDERIAPIMRKPEFTVVTSRHTVKIRNTNKLIGGEVDVRGGKTGFISKAGYCLATLLKLPQGDQVAVVVMGAQSNASRFWETRHLFNWLSTRAQDLFSRKTPQEQ
jgi:D-alanyl-D-alanine endopeptidase (penicillin-binding protein 7)